MPKGKLSVVLGPAQETLLITLYGRAVETIKRSGLIDDPRAVEIAEQLNYNFAKWNGARSLAAATLRTRMFDEDVQAFLAEHPAGTIVELGCGLNTRFERIDNGLAQWVDIDLADAIELRRRFFPDHPRRTVIAADLTDPGLAGGTRNVEQTLLFCCRGRRDVSRPARCGAVTFAVGYSFSGFLAHA
jgi:O-methyltransferase involved in polyketide biosynthesis